jgi:hypothetical protein
MANKGGFKNIKLGKNVYRQVKRKGRPEYQAPKPPPRPPAKRSDSGH